MSNALAKLWQVINVLLDAGIILMLVYRVFDRSLSELALLHLILALVAALVMPFLFRELQRDWKKLLKRRKRSGARAY